jgi:uncharacterized membrane-anchored protein YjiN (DUF445 family)
MDADTQLLLDSYKLDISYMSAEMYDVREENKYLRKVIFDLYQSIMNQTINREDNMSESLNSALESAEEVLGYVE